MWFVAYAQDFKKFNWIDIQQNKTIKLHGQLWGEQLKNRFDRLPASYENIVRKEVWNLSQNSAGIYLDFYTSANSLVLKYKYNGKEALKHMSFIGVAGIDIYAKLHSNKWVWVKGKYTSIKKDSVVIVFEELKAQQVSTYRLYLPLYTSITDLQIGLNKGELLQKVNLPKPIIVYGTSIAQGASASRSGMAWTAILGRAVEEPIVNLGFSANGRLEKELVDLIASQEASVYIIDCLPNLVHFSNNEAYQRLQYALKTLREKNPQTPIIFTEHADATIDLLNNSSQQEYERVNNNFKKFIAENVTGKDKNVYVVTAQSIGLGIDDTADGIHPSDLGMKKYADAYKKVLDVIGIN